MDINFTRITLLLYITIAGDGQMCSLRLPFRHKERRGSTYAQCAQERFLGWVHRVVASVCSFDAKLCLCSRVYVIGIWSLQFTVTAIVASTDVTAVVSCVHKCTKCPQTFDNAEDKEVHRGTHGFPCELCDEICTRKVLLRWHMANQHKQLLPGTYVVRLSVLRQKIVCCGNL